MEWHEKPFGWLWKLVYNNVNNILEYVGIHTISIVKTKNT